MTPTSVTEVYEVFKGLIRELKGKLIFHTKPGSGYVSRSMQLAWERQGNILCLYAVAGVYAIPTEFVPIEEPGDDTLLEAAALAADAPKS